MIQVHFQAKDLARAAVRREETFTDSDKQSTLIPTCWFWYINMKDGENILSYSVVSTPLCLSDTCPAHRSESLSVSQSCPTLCEPMDCSPPDSSVHWISQARILEWVALPFSRGSSWPRDQTWVSCSAGGLLTVWATSEAHLDHYLALFQMIPQELS